MATEKKYPIDEQVFANIRKDGHVYINKTHLIYNIVSERVKHFFFRPRRFGKSLLYNAVLYRRLPA